MNLRHCYPRRAVVACLAVLIAACGGNPPEQQAREPQAEPAGDFFTGTRSVFARLVNDRGGSWVFTDVTEADAPLESGYLVRLNDLTAAFDVRAAECMPQVYPDGHRCSPIHPFRDKHAGVIDKLISGGIAVGTAGKVGDFSQSYETRFDESDFNRAVDEALINTGLESDRRRLIKLIEQYDAQFNDAQSRLDEATKRLAAVRNDVGSIPLDIRPSIEGLTEYYEGDIDFERLLHLEPIADTGQPTVRLKRKEILPCDARQCVAGVEDAISELQQQVREHDARFAAVAQPGKPVFRVSCEQPAVDGYLLVAECPSEVVTPESGPVTVPIRVTILSRDFENLYPGFDLGDRHLRVDIDGRSVTFTNITGEYLSVNAQTVYYNSQVHTTSLPIDIPPGISVTRGIGEFISRPIGIESTYRQMTPDKASGTDFRFGFAVRYRVASRDEEQTLHDQRSFNVGCVISNRIQPGSCRPESLADANPPDSTNPVEREEFGPL